MAVKKKPKKKNKKRSTGHPNGLRPQLLMATILLGILTLAALYLARGPVSPDLPDSFQTEDLAVEIESVLLRSGIALQQIEIQREPGLINYSVSGLMPPREVVDRLQERLSSRFAGIAKDYKSETGELLIYRNGSLVAVMTFEIDERAIPPLIPDTVRPPRIAIIIDDLGRSLNVARQLLDLDLPLTYAVLPGEPLATEVALLASRAGQEVMVHLPMEPQSYPETNPGRDALLLGQDEKEIRTRIEAMIKKVPYASGANNHMGSRYTEYPAGMRVVLETMREKGLFFVDSRTTSRSVVKQEADRAGVPIAIRDVFLDNNADVEAIRVEIRRLVRRAKKNGQAVGICHPYPETVEALRLERELLQDKSIELVFASRLVRL